MGSSAKRRRYGLLVVGGGTLFLILYLTFGPIQIDPNSTLYQVQCDDDGSVLSESPAGTEGRYSDRIEESELCSGNLRIRQNDSRLVNYIRSHHLIPPSKEIYDLAPKHPKVDAVWNNLVAKRVLELLKHKKDGFFVECGANDGQFLSNTLLLETDFGWTGLLVEADPRPLEKLIKRHRKAWVADVCLSTVPYPLKITMWRHKEWEAMSFIPSAFVQRRMSDYEKFEAQCFPFFSVMSAMNVFEVDYFSMDIEGAELQILKTVPFDSIFIKVFSIEVSPEAAGPVELFMASKGYLLDGLIQETHTRDHIYIQKSLL